MPRAFRSPTMTVGSRSAAGRSPAGLAGDFAGRNRDQRALIRLHLVHERQQIGARIAFDVVLDRRPSGRPSARRDVADIVRRDVPAIGARVHGDAVHAGVQADGNGVEHARHAAAARIAQRRDLVDVDRQADHESGYLVI